MPTFFLLTIRDRSKFTGYPGRVLGIFQPIKNFVPPFYFSKKNISPPFFFTKKSSSPLIFFSKKILGPPFFCRKYVVAREKVLAPLLLHQKKSPPVFWSPKKVHQNMADVRIGPRSRPCNQNVLTTTPEVHACYREVCHYNRLLTYVN